LETRQADLVMQRAGYSCGAAALATLLTFEFGDNVSEREVAASMLRRPDLIGAQYRLGKLEDLGGFSLLDLENYAKRRQGYAGEPSVADSIDDIKANTPLIAAIETRGLKHFVVVRGFIGDRIALADSAWGNRTMWVKDFKEAWKGHLVFILKRNGMKNFSNLLTLRPEDHLLPTE